MVHLLLSVKADLENVTDLVKCTSCNEVHPKMVSEEREVTSGKGSVAHFVWRCGLCKRDGRQWPVRAFLTIDCRGLEFVGFDPRGTWRCVGAESATVFDEVDLDEGEWVDYDEKAALPVGISNIESKWTRA
ncbi:uncharacterized protein B0H18DRAFT_1081454 [Fomitopsis serialis]|uniref:uncharacterized protein n=1 Tax=Fomitopsis serialis TaxID=139415 RepID=UPI002007D491|nr:uncharacterized protein B0H18DRAFT_1081454 [Neoantrodia serialis]KAH9937199.1 hypothetical protein B0H18DRAFT_1081454 [Neoantrodia serialis]